MKKISSNTIANIIAAGLMLITLIVVEISFQTSQGWFDLSNNPAIIALAIVGILLLLVIVVLNITGIGKDQKWVNPLKILCSTGACACAGVIVGLVIGAIATEFAFTFLSNFNEGTVKEHFMPTACIQAVVGIVISVLTILAAAIANAFDTKKE